MGFKVRTHLVHVELSSHMGKGRGQAGSWFLHLLFKATDAIIEGLPL